MNGSSTTPPPISTIAVSSDKLSGQLIIKAQLGDDIRKMMIHNEDLTLNELVLMMERIFAGKISNSDELTIKYLDDDGDKITLLNDSDLTVALHFHKILRLFVLVNGNEQISTNSTENSSQDGSLIDAKTFRTELQQIRNSVQTILDRLQLSASQTVVTNNQEKETTAVPPPAVASNTARDFDPYKHFQQPQRSNTPDSIRSKSSTSNKLNPNEQKSFQAISSAPTIDAQNQFQASESVDKNKTHATAFQQMPTPQQFMPTPYDDQQPKASPFGAPPSTFPVMPPIPPNTGNQQFPIPYPPTTLPNASTSSVFNTASAPPIAPPSAFNSNPLGPPPTTSSSSSNLGQPSAFIGQQQTPLAPPPQVGGFYGQQQALFQQRAGPSTFIPNNTANPNNTLGQGPPGPPPTSSSPATINPSFIQPTQMPTPPPLASKQPYGGFPGQNNFYNPTQQYPRQS
ncbi:unnamed protein product [Adineta ricciae]|uniref:PB1 domain-containing protein n=1 Tax=Adineta ricciae TaxID=249248 RepID=A0A813W8P0_ADIRI|nr:unnamed protein product [Adineta ricciae]